MRLPIPFDMRSAAPGLRRVHGGLDAQRVAGHTFRIDAMELPMISPCVPLPPRCLALRRIPVAPALVGAALLALGACTGPAGSGGDPSPGFLSEVPEQVALLAAPYQDLRAVRVLPEDGCYWYRHVGPVETTLLPLRTADGRPICTPRAVPPADGT